MNVHRSPVETRPARLGPLAKLPVFFDLAGQRAIVAGGAAGAAWKAELLAAAGANVEVFAENPGSEMSALVASLGREGQIKIFERPWTRADLDGAAIAVGDFRDKEQAEVFAATARILRVPVNIVDQPALCDFQFGAIVNRSPVVVAISTGGGAPVLGQAIRRKIEAILPASLGAWASAALAFRSRLAQLLPGKTARRKFWEAFVDQAFARQADDPSSELERIADEIGAAVSAEKGAVILVGAGPGDPELLTLKAVRAMQAADVIVYDRLVTLGILELARREAQRIEVGKKGHGAACTQEEINELLIALAGKGLQVVRLKGGDPTIFGRAGEEVAACLAAGVAVSIVPGITAASAAAAALNGSLTHRDHAHRVQFVTAHDRNGWLPRDLDFTALSDAGATTCVYMPGRAVEELAAKLIAHGLPAETPATLAWNVSRPDQRIVQITLGEINAVRLISSDAPLIALIGRVSPLIEAVAKLKPTSAGECGAPHPTDGVARLQRHATFPSNLAGKNRPRKVAT